MTGAEHAVGANMVALVGAAVAAIVFLARWNVVRGIDLPEMRVAAFAYLVIGAGMLLAAIQRGYWQVYYFALADGADTVARPLIEYQNFAAHFVLAWGIVALLHARFAISHLVGTRHWLVVAAIIALAAYVFGSAIAVSG